MNLLYGMDALQFKKKHSSWTVIKQLDIISFTMKCEKWYIINEITIITNWMFIYYNFYWIHAEHNLIN